MCTCTHIKSRKNINCIQSFPQTPAGSLSGCQCTPTPGLTSSPAGDTACGCPCTRATTATRAPQTPPCSTHPAHPSCTAPSEHRARDRPFFGVNLSLSSGHLFPYQPGSLIPQARGRLGTPLSEFYVQLRLLIAQISHYKNKKKQQQPVTRISQCPHHQFPPSGPAHHPQLTEKKETQRIQDART